MCEIQGQSVPVEKEAVVTAKCPKCDNEIDYGTFVKDKGKCSCSENYDLYLNGELAKKCRGECGEVKVVGDFNNEKNGKYGVKGKCKICYRKEREAYRQSEQGRATEKAYHNRPDVKAKAQTRRKERNKLPEVKTAKAAYMKKYNQRPEVIKQKTKKKEANRRKGSGKFSNIYLPQLTWRLRRCPWHKDGKIFDVETAKESGITHIVYILVVREGKGIIPDNSKYAGVTNILTNTWKAYIGKSWNSNFKEYLKNNKNKVERHVIAAVKSEAEAAEIELDLLAHDDNTGIARWKPERTDWLNLHPGGQIRKREIFNITEVTDEIIDKFEKNINKNGPKITDSSAYPEIINTQCWLWTGCLEGIGYGAFTILGRKVKAHRASKMIYNGHEFKEGEFANHKCNKPECVNPEHIYVGSAKDNSRDTIKSNKKNLNFTNKNNKGEDNSRSLLTWEEARIIREKYNPHIYTQTMLAKEFDVKRGVIGDVLRNRTYKIEDDPLN